MRQKSAAIVPLVRSENGNLLVLLTSTGQSLLSCQGSNRNKSQSVTPSIDLMIIPSVSWLMVRHVTNWDSAPMRIADDRNVSLQICSFSLYVYSVCLQAEKSFYADFKIAGRCLTQYIFKAYSTLHIAWVKSSGRSFNFVCFPRIR